MAKSLVGEVNFMGFTLRPSLAALYEIEQTLDREIRQLAVSPTRRQASTIVAMGNHGFILKLLLPFIPTETLTKTARQFLLMGLGYSQEEALTVGPADMKSLAKLDWDDLLRIATGLLGQSIEAFWQLTITEFTRIYEGFCLRTNTQMPDHSLPASPEEVALMMQRFPDMKG